MEQIYTKYQKAAKSYSGKFDISDNRIINIITSVMMTRDGVGYPGGGFVQAVVNNNLFEAVSRADSECIKYIREIVSACQWARV
jgi:hypothetical protein